MKTTDSSNRAAAARLIAERLAEDLVRALKDRETVVFLASGGGSPREVLVNLAAADLDWSRVVVSLSDERCVPGDHPHSNMRMAREALSGGDARLARTVPLWERGDADGRAAVERVNASLSGLMPFDVSLIGMGMDGHTASIFPNGAGMDHARSAPGPFCATEPDPLPDEAPWPRITATLPALTQVRAQHLMLFGAEKAGVFRKLVETELSSPIAVLVKGSEERLTAHFCV